MAESGQPAAADPAAPAPARRPLGRRLSAWAAQERVFRLIPFIAVEAVFILVIIIPFILTIYISLLRWRANRPFEQASFSGFLNYGRVLGKDEFWMALGRTFYFAGAAVISSSWSGSSSPTSCTGTSGGGASTSRSSSPR